MRQILQDEEMPVDDAPADEGDGAPRQSYNFAPGYHGIVYRADVPDWGAGPRREAKVKSRAEYSRYPTKKKDTAGHDDDDDVGDEGKHEIEGPADAERGEMKQTQTQTHYKLQSMKWGLVPFWTKRNPDYAAVMKTINCRDDSLAQTGGMWSSMKGRKRCVVVAQGFYEWLKSGKEKVPHFVKRKDGKLMCFAGLWDCVQYEGKLRAPSSRSLVIHEANLLGTRKDTEDKHYTYTIITTDSNKQLKFLHDRMPVIFDPASEKIKTWLDPGRYEWSKDLQDVLKPFDGELEVYPVSKDVGKVGNNSPTFIIPIASRENKSNIANFFANAQSKTKTEKKDDVEVKRPGSPAKMTTTDDLVEDADDGGIGIGVTSTAATAGVKRKADSGDPRDENRPLKKEAISSSSIAKVDKAKDSLSPKKPVAKNAKSISSTSNGTKSPAKSKASGTPKITRFFGNSA